MSRVVSARAIRRLRYDVDERPFLVIWEVTRACELACRHCRAEASPNRDPRELSTAEGQRLLDDLAELGAPSPMVVLTGGDPFERRDLSELVAHGTAAGLAISIAPSVTAKLTRSRLAELREAGARAVSLSLDGATAATHDTFRGYDSVFADTLRAAEWVRELGFRLQINTTVTRANLAELVGILATVVGLHAWLWSVFFLVETGRGRDLGQLSAQEVEDVLHFLQDASRHVAVKATEAPHYRRVLLQRGTGDSPTPPTSTTYRRLRADLQALRPLLPPPRRATRPPLDVNAGRGFVFVSHVGAVQPSGFLPFTAGSVRERPLSAIYRDAWLLQRLRDPDALAGKCGACEFRTICGGSRSRAFAHTGDPFGAEPLCAYEPDGSV